ncbi:uncharacterized protein LOC133194513 [Saccostrea echinata]|uniref:uncharacterized protein LOC133194513 n=1 Tax=Saccostrea echinata TaxID=191078 RepID=UPI002A8401B7|nr:uncharacterized protein LOC133194513 [Saccostrea echinata]
MTVENCRKMCMKENNQYYGVQASSWCFCGDALTKYVKKPEGECNMKCVGNKKEICGGGWRMNIYRNPDYNKEYLGCFQDQHNRVLTGKYAHTNSMTVQNCREMCMKENNQYYGVQASSWCFCGDALTKYVKKSEGECNMKCVGNNKEICGGGWRMNIYRNPDYNKGYLGCFQDQHNRVLTGKYAHTNTMTVQNCREMCIKENNQYYGVQASSWCFCGDALTKYVKKPEGECNMKCVGNKKEICGGGWRMNIYRNPGHNKGYLGCFKDQHNRVLTGKYAHTNSMTVQNCREMCMKENNQYYGVQASSWCFCGDDLTKYVKKPEGECNMKCVGNKKEICGGGWRMNIYRNPDFIKG